MSEHSIKALRDASLRLERASVLLREAAQYEERGANYDHLLWDVGEAMYDVTKLVPPRPLPYDTEPRCPRCADRGTDDDHACHCEAGEPYRRSVQP